MMTILIIDDDPLMRELWTRRLQEILPCEIMIAEDGAEGYELVKTTKPNLIICDFSMPTMNGFEFWETLRTKLQNQSSYFILSTSHIAPNGIILKYNSEIGMIKADTRAWALGKDIPSRKRVEAMLAVVNSGNHE